MGYTTDFEGKFKIQPALPPKFIEYVKKFCETRRMKRNFGSNKYGTEGEFYVDGSGDYGQAKEDSIVDYNTPPSTQPSLWCQWTSTDCGNFIEWDGGEKFHNYIEWLSYMINSFFEPNNFKLNGVVEWFGEDRSDTGEIRVNNNVIIVDRGNGNPEIIIPKTVNSIILIDGLTLIENEEK